MVKIAFSNQDHQKCINLPSEILQEDDPEKLCSILNKEKVDWHDDKGQSPLHLAAFYHAPKCIQVLLELGAKIEETDEQGLTPLLSSLKVLFGDERETKTVSLLLQNGANPLALTKENQPAQELAANNFGVKVLIEAATNEQMYRDLLKNSPSETVNSCS